MKINSAACPICKGDGSVTRNDCAGRSRSYACDSCEGAGTIYADDEDAVAGLQDALDHNNERAVVCQEEIDWLHTVGATRFSAEHVAGRVDHFKACMSAHKIKAWSIERVLGEFSN